MDTQSEDIRLHNLRCEYRRDLIGIDGIPPRFSWEISAERRGVTQEAYRIQVADDEAALSDGTNLLWDSGPIDSSASVQRPYGGPALESRQRCHWRVRIRDETNMLSPWSDPAVFEIGLLSPEDWRASWIEPDLGETNDRPAPYLRRSFEVDPNRNVRSARAYVTAHGVHELSVNGNRVGDAVFPPGWTSYHKRLQYQTYEITNTLHAGENAVGAILGDGWWRGKVAAQSQTDTYGTDLALLTQIHVEYEDGTEQLVCTDGDWEATDGPIRASDFKDGEIYDARYEMPGWNEPGFDDTWQAVAVVDHPMDTLVAAITPPVRRQETFEPERIIETPAGQTVLDMGQNFAGRVRLEAEGPRGTTVRLRHGESLNADGNFSMEHFGIAVGPIGDELLQETQYTFRGDGEPEAYGPRFTYHGFRYVLVEGFPGTPSVENFTGVALYSDLPETGTFECSDERLNRLYENIRWSQRSNFVDVPTDCPTRERAGWTGDVQIFAPTSSFNAETVTFLRKWLRDLEADQQSNGRVPNLVPDPFAGAGNSSRLLEAADGAAGWGDAAVIVPWVLFQWYGDERVLEEQYRSMRAWVEYARSRAERTPWYKLVDPQFWVDGDRRRRERYLWDTDYHWGEWLEPDDSLNPISLVSGLIRRFLFGAPEVATAYLAHSSGLLANAAEQIGRPEEASQYRGLSEAVREAFTEEFVGEDGRVGADKQASYVRALEFDLVPPSLRSRAAARLVELIRENDDKLSTGFLSTVFLLPVLVNEGYPEVAYDLLLRDEIPSWLYEIEQGATTIWELWDGVEPNGSVNGSLNHYSPGAVGQFLYEYVAGIRPAAPGFNRVEIRPVFGGGLTSARATYDSLYGPIKAEWEQTEDGINLAAVIPPNTEGIIILPGATEDSVASHDRELSSIEGVRSVTQTNDGIVLGVGAGRYEFGFAYAQALSCLSCAERQF